MDKKCKTCASHKILLSLGIIMDYICNFASRKQYGSQYFKLTKQLSYAEN